MSRQSKKLVFLITELGYFCSHRINLALAAKKAGYDVSLITNCDQRPSLKHYEAHLRKLKIYHVPFHRSRLNPLREIKTLWQIFQIYRKVKPDIVHQVALKPVLYGTLCARLLRIPRIINALGGMGYLFTHFSWKSVIIKPMIICAFRVLLSPSHCRIILQNQDDINLVGPHTNGSKIFLIPGSGVDLKKFSLTKEPPLPVTAVMVSRLLWSKGIGELVEAARILKRKSIPLKIIVAGDIDLQNPASVTQEELDGWKQENLIIWLGSCKDVAALYAKSHIAVLPSYREGLPKSLAEAAASGKPIITTDVPGCREVVKDGKNGILVPPQDVKALVGALEMLTNASPQFRREMGLASRKKAEQAFDEHKIIIQTLTTYL
ncbi:MAG: glycosyltransferase family 4 protein [Alphaproteobacteria bacterium]|nr:glycosyltransferase family 4 protein [Alphaproteobacteria bacterium]